MIKHIKKYIKNILIWLDEGLNTALAGDPDETLSSRAAKWADAGFIWPAQIIDCIFGVGHCLSSLQEDRGEKEIFVDRDKQLHFIGGFFVCLFAGWAVTPLKGLFAAVGAGGLWGLREIWNEFKGKGTYDVWETGAMWAGGAVGYLILLGVSI